VAPQWTSSSSSSSSSSVYPAGQPDCIATPVCVHVDDHVCRQGEHRQTRGPGRVRNLYRVRRPPEGLHAPPRPYRASC
jgi:hypothetical protein